MTLRFVLNGETVDVADVDHHVTLLQWLRASGRTGTKEGCSEGECGACAVALWRHDANGPGRLDSINSCLVPLPAMHGQTIVSVEGVADASGELHPVQRAMVEQGGSQCGYCTPGFVVSLFCEYHRPGREGYDPEAISGNLCRCTGYRPIADVARALPTISARDVRLDALKRAASALTPFEHVSATSRYARPTHLRGLWQCLADHPTAVLIAGGTDLMVYANQRYERFATLVSIEGIAELQTVTVGASEIVLGAGVGLADLERRLRDEHPGSVPLFEQLLPLFSSRLIRNRATLGGNLATASPIGDSLPVLLALDAEVTLASADGSRRLALADFLVGYRRTALRSGEVIVSVHLPLPLPALQRFYKVSKRTLDDISTVSAAFALELDHAGRVARLRAAYGGVAATALRAHALERAALGLPWSTSTQRTLLEQLADLGSPMADHRGSAAYRRAMMGKLFEKFCAETSTPARSS